MKNVNLSNTVTSEQYIDIIQKLNKIEDYFYNVLTTSQNPLDLKYGIISSALKEIIRGNVEFIYEKLFKLVDIIEITIPENYNKIVNNIDVNYFSYYNSKFDIYNLDTSNLLLTGDKYKIKIFDIIDHSKNSFSLFNRKNIRVSRLINSEIIIDFIKKQKAILTGSLGIKLLFEINKNLFPFEKWILSFEQFEYYSKISNEERGIPAIYRCSGNDWAVSVLNSFEKGIDPTVCSFIVFAKDD